MAVKYKGVLTNARSINIESASLVRFVQNDKDTNVIDFELLKEDSTLPDIDFSQANITINYSNVDADTGESITDIYLVDNPDISDDYISFSWVVGSNASVYAGMCFFQIIITLTDDNDVITKQWQSVINKIPVCKSLENVNITQPKSFIDLSNQLKKSVSDVKERLAVVITDKGVETASSADFDTIINNVKQIQTGVNNTQVLEDVLVSSVAITKVTVEDVEDTEE